MRQVTEDFIAPCYFEDLGVDKSLYRSVERRTCTQLSVMIRVYLYDVSLCLARGLLPWFTSEEGIVSVCKKCDLS